MVAQVEAAAAVVAAAAVAATEIATEVVIEEEDAAEIAVEVVVAAGDATEEAVAVLTLEQSMLVASYPASEWNSLSEEQVKQVWKLRDERDNKRNTFEVGTGDKDDPVNNSIGTQFGRKGSKGRGKNVTFEDESEG